MLLEEGSFVVLVIESDARVRPSQRESSFDMQERFPHAALPLPCRHAPPEPRPRRTVKPTDVKRRRRARHFPHRATSSPRAEHSRPSMDHQHPAPPHRALVRREVDGTVDRFQRRPLAKVLLAAVRRLPGAHDVIEGRRA